jgi:hypothetical protein
MAAEGAIIYETRPFLGGQDKLGFFMTSEFIEG